MTLEEYKAAKPRLIELLSESEPLPPRALHEKLMKDGHLPKREAYDAIARMIDDGTIDLRIDRRFEFVPDPQTHWTLPRR